MLDFYMRQSYDIANDSVSFNVFRLSAVVSDVKQEYDHVIDEFDSDADKTVDVFEHDLFERLRLPYIVFFYIDLFAWLYLHV
jgi:hypothetical protein